MSHFALPAVSSNQLELAAHLPNKQGGQMGAARKDAPPKGVLRVG